MRTIEQLVAAEVHYCVSALVSEIAGTVCSPLGEQAVELASPIPDYESAAEDAGFSIPGMDPDPQDAYRRICEENDIEPYDREVFEHWIVSDWLADRLAEQGEKVDKDFCGLTVWARTTTGQGIASDSVIERIHAALMAA